MRRRMNFKAAIIGKGGLYNITLVLDSPEIGKFNVELKELGLSDDELEAIINADEVEGVAYFNALRTENNGILKILELKPFSAPAAKQEKTKSLSKEFNGKIVMELESNPPQLVVETDEGGEITVSLGDVNIDFDVYQKLYDNGVTGKYQDDDNGMSSLKNGKRVKVTSLKPR